MANTSNIATAPNLRAAQSSSSSGKRKPIPTPLGVNLHMDSLKSLLVEPDSPGFSKSGRQSSRQRSETALAHQARLKMPLRQTAKATQDIYTGMKPLHAWYGDDFLIFGPAYTNPQFHFSLVGLPRATVKKQSALSPDDENDSTASEETKVRTITDERASLLWLLKETFDLINSFA